MNATSEPRPHRGTQRELVQQPRRVSLNRAIYKPNTSSADRSPPRLHVTTSRPPHASSRGQRGGTSSIKSGHVRGLSSLRVEMNQWKLERDGAAEERFPFPFSIGCIKGKRQLRGGGHATLSQRLICNSATLETLTHPGRRTPATTFSRRLAVICPHKCHNSLVPLWPAGRVKRFAVAVKHCSPLTDRYFISIFSQFELL